MFASFVFPDKNQKPLHVSRMQITKQAVAILSLISANVYWINLYQILQYVSTLFSLFLEKLVKIFAETYS